MTCKDFFDQWMECFIIPKKTLSTVSSYRTVIAHLPPAIMEAEIETINAFDLQKAINDYASVSERQAQILFYVLSASFRKASKMNLILSNPFEALEKPTHRPAVTQILTPEQLMQYIVKCKGNASELPQLLMAAYGLRRGEALGILPIDVQKENGDCYLSITRQRRNGHYMKLKTESSNRKLFIDPEISDRILALMKENRPPVSEARLYADHALTLHRIGIPPNAKITLHSLRHSLATAEAKAGYPMKLLQYQLGHSTPKLTLSLYSNHISPPDTKKAFSSWKTIAI